MTIDELTYWMFWYNLAALAFCSLSLLVQYIDNNNNKEEIMLESKFQAILKTRCQEEGAFYKKFNERFASGWPDCLLAANDKSIYVELKTFDSEPTPAAMLKAFTGLQQVTLHRLNMYGLTARGLVAVGENKRDLMLFMYNPVNGHLYKIGLLQCFKSIEDLIVRLSADN